MLLTWRPVLRRSWASGSSEIFDFGRVTSREAVADTLVQTTRDEAEIQILDLNLAVANMWYAVRAAHEVLLAAVQAVDRAKVDRDAAQAGVRAGLLKPTDLTLADAQYARFDVGRISALASLAESQAMFAAAVGVNDMRLDAAGDAPSLTPLPSLNAALGLAHQRDPGVLAAAASLEGQRQTTHAIDSQLHPDLRLTATVSTRAGGALPSGGPEAYGFGILPYIPNYDAGLVLTVPLYDPVIARERDASRQLEEVRREELAATSLQVTEGVQQAYLKVQLADQAMGALDRSVTAARANNDLARARFGAGLGTSVELADAEDLRVQAEIQLAVGRFEQSRTRALLSRALAEGL